MKCEVQCAKWDFKIIYILTPHMSHLSQHDVNISINEIVYGERKNKDNKDKEM